jgi:RNA polymerase subunit RPABC4/transcription elongation factor Spt4
MFLPAVFGIKSSGLNLAANLVLLFLVVVWLALVYWTYADARRRIADPMLVGCATAASLFPFVGTIVYMIVRPPEYLDDVRERELEIQAAEARLAQAGYHVCPHCDAEVEKDFLRCPSCMRKLKDPCRTCGRPLDPDWKICPFCESEVGTVAATPRRSRRRRETAATERSVVAERRDPTPVPADRREPAAVPDRRDGATVADRREAAAVAERREAAAENPAAGRTKLT